MRPLLKLTYSVSESEITFLDTTVYKGKDVWNPEYLTSNPLSNPQIIFNIYTHQVFIRNPFSQDLLSVNV